MVFTSFQFLFIFLPIIYIGFLLFSIKGKVKQISLWLVGASIAFYAFWNPKDLLPLIVSILINYTIYLGMIKPKNGIFSTNKNRPAFFLILGITFNILFLGYYKYMDFFLKELFNLSSNLNINLNSSLNKLSTFIHNDPNKKIITHIPLGISFYTFTQIAFLVDCYKNQTEKNDLTPYKNDFINYFLFVSYFPHLVCGPILSFKELYPQLINSQKFKASLQNVSLFLFCFSIGIFKKTVLADYLGLFVTQVFDASPYSLFTFKTVLLGTISYSMQLYFDFSGYTDMAVGLSYLFGLKIPDNFNAPYQATSIIDFWRRWHISLSHFLKMYVYIPLGGNRGSAFNLYRNLWITMLLGGLWHGASYTFILWGAYQGLLLSLNHLIRNNVFSNLMQSILEPISFLKKKLAERVTLQRRVRGTQTSFFIIPIKILTTFTLISLGWILFRSPNLHYAINLYKSLLFLHGDVTLTYNSTIQWLILFTSLFIAFFLPDTLTLRERFFYSIQQPNQKAIISSAFACAWMMIVGILCISRVQYFLYSGF